MGGSIAMAKADELSRLILARSLKGDLTHLSVIPQYSAKERERWAASVRGSVGESVHANGPDPVAAIIAALKMKVDKPPQSKRREREEDFG